MIDQFIFQIMFYREKWGKQATKKRPVLGLELNILMKKRVRETVFLDLNTP